MSVFHSVMELFLNIMDGGGGGGWGEWRRNRSR